MSHTAVTTNKTSGVVVELKDRVLVLSLPNTDYQLHLGLSGSGKWTPGESVTGTIRARAKRVDVVNTGGRYVEPLYGRPRRVQGTVIASDAGSNSLMVHCAPGCAMVCELIAGQRASDFSPGVLVSFDVERGAAFEPI